VDCTGDGVPPLSPADSLSAGRWVDLHLHSTASDGEFTPDDVIARAREVGLGAVALTDHDTLDGIAAAEAAGRRLGIRVIGGCEFSVVAPWGEMHLLGYFLPPDCPPLNRFLQEARADRRRRGQGMVQRLQALGVGIELEDLLSEADGGAIGRPHVARALLRRGLVSSVNDAFDRFIGKGRPAFVEKELPTLRTIADIVHAIGGLVSAAHLKDRGTRRVLRRFKEDGLDAVETRHPSHDPEIRARLTDHALALGLLRTGGSDWHGEDNGGMTHAAMGSQDVPYEWLERLEAARPSQQVGGAR
jgi:predicted metal-dependent phosphoesterase TrpH